MAIDNAEKRKSLSGIQVTLMPGVTPDTSKDQEWRQQAGWGYSGILASAIAALRLVGKRKVFTLDTQVRIFKRVRA